MKDINKYIVVCIFIIVFSCLILGGIKYHEQFGQVESTVNNMAGLLSDMDRGNIVAPSVKASTTLQVGPDIMLDKSGKVSADNIVADNAITSKTVQASVVDASNIKADGTITASSVNANGICINGTCINEKQLGQLISVSSNPANIALQNPVREYPPAGIPVGSQWIKDTNDQISGVERNYVKYKVNAQNVAYGGGEYVAWANSIWDYQDSRGFNPGEWPASGAFDKRGGGSGLNSGWHISGSSCSVVNSRDWNVPFVLGIKLPNAILLRSYKLQTRSDGCCPEQMPSKWKIEGSNDGNNWTQLDYRENIQGWKVSEEREFTLGNLPSQLYNHYRIVMFRNSSGGNNCLHIGEFRLYGSTAA